MTKTYQKKYIIQIHLLDATIMLLKMSCMNQCHLKIMTNMTAMLIISFLPTRWASTLNKGPNGPKSYATVFEAAIIKRDYIYI